MSDRDEWRRSGDWIGRIELLERRLADYHEHLEDSLEHDRQFQLKATWGIVNSMLGLAAVAALVWLVGKLELSGWVEGVIVGLGWIFAYAAGYAWSDRGREGDLKKLSHLPTWEGK
jgi:hypothetical protein